MVKALAKHAQINLAYQGVATPFSIAVAKGHLDVAEELIQNCAHVRFEHLLPSALLGYLLMLTTSGQVDVGLADGRTPLHMAVLKGDLERIKFLVEHKASVNNHDSNNDTPLLLALRAGHTDIALYLLSHSADATISSKFDSKTALHHAATFGNPELVGTILKHLNIR